jgi:trans-aconitate methyltransferase
MMLLMRTGHTTKRELLPLTEAISTAGRSAVGDYFARRYPSRRGLLSRLFRRNEEDLRKIVGPLLREDGCERILDLGCGDGMMLASALARPLAEIVLVDVAERNVTAACAALADSAALVRPLVGDVRTFPVAGHDADLVLMLGVLDYLPDWREVLARILRETKGTLLVNVPRSDQSWHRLRRIWLATRGIGLTRTDRGELKGVVKGTQRTAVIFGDRFSWYLLSRPAKRAIC